MRTAAQSFSLSAKKNPADMVMRAGSSGRNEPMKSSQPRCLVMVNQTLTGSRPPSDQSRNNRDDEGDRSTASHCRKGGLERHDAAILSRSHCFTMSDGIPA